jgi:uncharacterized damage-inducible protein DinB/heme-degrading monooxygenase HmoA
MIARSWDGLTPVALADEYADYIRRTGFKDLLATSGNKGALVLRRKEGEQARFRVLSLWDGLDAIRRFAGDDPERARYYPEDERYLAALPPHVEHFEVVAESGEREGGSARSARLARELETLSHGDTWHGPALDELLDGVSPEAAAARPIATGHSIWELVLHVTAWTDVFRRRLEGAAVEEPEAGDFPKPPRPSAAGWEAAKLALIDANAALAARVERLSDADLAVKVPGRPFDAEFQVRAAIRHTVYHSGQIGLLRKAAQ